MKLATVLAFACFVVAVAKGAGWILSQSVPAAVALIAAGLALQILSAVDVVGRTR